MNDRDVVFLRMFAGCRKSLLRPTRPYDVVGAFLVCSLLAPLVPVSPVGAEGEWYIQTVDNNVDGFACKSLAFGPSGPAISYYDYPNYDLKFAYDRNSDGDFADAGEIQTVDSNGAMSACTSLAFGPSGPAISYCDYQNYDLKFAYDRDGDGDFADAGEIRTVDGDCSVGGPVSLAFGPSGPAISYYYYAYGPPEHGLKFAYDRNGDGDFADAGEIQTVDGDCHVGGSVSLAFGPSGPAISYYNDRDLNFAYDRNGDGDFDDVGETQTVDSEMDVVACTSLAFGPFGPAISYYDYEPSNPGLKFLYDRNGDGDFADAGEIQSVDSDCDVGYYASLAFGPSGPAISYADWSGCDVKLAYDRNGDGDFWDAGETQVVDSENAVNLGAYTSLAFGPLGPAISYSRLGDLRFACKMQSSPAMVKGLDVSHYQGGIDWGAVHASGYGFAFVKATEGDDRPPQYVDDSLHQNMQEGRAAGMLTGAYHLAYPHMCVAEDEARHFVAVAGDYIDEGYLRPVLDLERGSELGTAALSDWVHEFIATVEGSTGVTPLIYTTKSFAQNELDASIAQYDLWLADWTCSTSDLPSEADTGIWEGDWAFWQYWEPESENCGIQPVSGIAGGVDLDLFNGDFSELEAFCIEPGDHEPPKVEALSVEPYTAVTGEEFTISFTVSDSQSGLCWVELWRRHEAGDWEQIGDALDLTEAERGPYCACFLDDTCSETGMHEYGIHVGDSEGNWTTERGSGLMPVQVEVTANAMPECVIELREEDATFPASIVDVGETFDIFVGDSSDDIGIESVRFASDCYQDDELTSEWTQWYDWEASSGNWNASQKTRSWSFPVGGAKEVWAEVRDFAGQTDTDHAFIKTLYAPNPYGYRFENREPWGVREEGRCLIFDEVFGPNDAFDAIKIELVDQFCGGGHCFGLAASSLLEYADPQCDSFVEDSGVATVFDLNADGSDPHEMLRWLPTRWDGRGDLELRPLLKRLMTFQLRAYDSLAEGLPQADKYDSVEGLPQEGKLELFRSLGKDYATECFVIGIEYKIVYETEEGKTKTKEEAHALVPYEIVDNRIHVYDPNHPDDSDRWLELSQEYPWGWKYGTWPPESDNESKDACYARVWLYSIEDIVRPRDWDFPKAYWYLERARTKLLQDSQGRRTGFHNCQYLAEIPDVELVPLCGALFEDESTTVPHVVYLDENTNLAAVVGGNANEAYSVSRVEDEYFCDVVGTFAHDQDEHTVSASADELRISFKEVAPSADPSEGAEQNGAYRARLHNCIEGIDQEVTVGPVAPSPGATHQYTVDWQALADDMPAVTVSKDSDGDGTFEEVATTTPPLTLSSPLPPDGASDIGDGTTLSWTGGDPDSGDTVTCSVRLAANREPFLVAEGLSEWEYSTETLMPGQTYYWQVIARDNHGVTTEGPVWCFSTAGDPLVEGDVNLDGVTNIVDAMFIAQYTVGLRELDDCQMACGDTTDDGAVNIVDAMHIAQYTVDPHCTGGVLFKPLWESPEDDGLIDPLPCP